MIRALARTIAAALHRRDARRDAEAPQPPRTRKTAAVTATSDLQFTPGTTHVTLASGEQRHASRGYSRA